MTLFNASLLGCIMLRKINLDYKYYFINLIKMILSAALAFSINYILYSYWVVENNWFLLALKTFIIFALSMITYIIFAAAFKIEYVGELIERIKNYIKRKFIC